jgi:hypothetical protein
MAIDALTSHRIHSRTHRAPTVWLRALLGLIVAGLLLTLGARTALAAPPTVTVSPPSPVCFSQASGTKQVALSYNLNGTPAARLYVRDDTAKTVVLDKPVSQMGTEPLTVTYGHVYSVQMLDMITYQNLLRGPITITTKVCDVVPPCVGCFQVTDIGVEPHGTWATFNINANQTAGFKLEISKSPPVNGKLSGVIFGAGTGGMVASPWKPDAEPLDAQTTYHYLVTATNAKGDIATKGGSFTTLTRSVTVKYDKVVINDDSDGWGAGACDCRLWFYVNGVQVGHISGDFDDSDSSGKITLSFNSVVVKPSKPTLALKVIGDDDDKDFTFDSCYYAVPPSGTGSNSCHDWTNATLDKTFPTGKSEVVPATTVSFSSAYNPLKFTVTATFSVDYTAP